MADRAAFLFDLDGTLIDTDPLHMAVFSEFFAARGKPIDEAFYLAEIHGGLNEAIFAKHFPDEDQDLLSEMKEAAFRERLGESVPPTPGILTLLDRAEEAGIAVAVVTNAPRENAVAMLAALALAERVPTVIVGRDHPPGKPDPAPYLAALKMLDADPARSVAFEDSPGGIRAAKGAGLYCVGIRSSLDDTALRAAGADLTVTDFTDPALSNPLARITGVTP